MVEIKTARKFSNRKLTDDEFLLKFSNLYSQLKSQSFYPLEIRSKMLEPLDISRGTYYKYLRLCRTKGLITDTYEETKMLSDAVRAEWLRENGGKIRGLHFAYPEMKIRRSIAIRTLGAIKVMVRRFIGKK